MTWWAPLLAAFALLLTYSLLRVVAVILVPEQTGWFFTSHSGRNLIVLLGTALFGPLLAASAAASLTAGRLLLWGDGSWWTLLWACLLAGAMAWWVLIRPFRSSPWPGPVRRFLVEWETLGLGEAPVVEVTTQPNIVRLRFRDTTVLTGQAKGLVDALEVGLTPRFRLVIWLGGKPWSESSG